MPNFFYPKNHSLPIGKWDMFYALCTKAIASFLIVFTLFFSNTLLAQTTDLTKCYGSCTSNDFTITRAILTDINGVPLTSSACNTPGTVVPAYLTLTFTNNTSSDRNGIFISGTINGNYIYNCFPGILPKKTATTFTDQTHVVQWTCGTDLTLVGTFTAWGSGSDQVCSQSCSQATPSKCRQVGDVVIQTPLSDNFSSSNTCVAGNNFQTVAFTGTVAGGNHLYTYLWNFGDGTTSTLQSPTHTYASAGNFTVSFKVTDGNNNNYTTTKTIAVVACCTTPTISNQPAAQTKCNGASATFTVASSGGNPAPTVQWQVQTAGSTAWTNLTNVSPYSGVTTTSLNVNPATTSLNGNSYRAILTSGACTPATSNAALLTVNAIPGAPTVTVVNNCDGSSDLTATNFTGSLLWSTGATTATIHVINAATYTVTQTVNGCTSSTGSGASAPKTAPAAPTVSAVNNCDGTSDLTASNYTGTLLWSNGATTPTIHVTDAATYTVTQSVNGCTSLPGSGMSAPRTTPVSPSVTYNAPACDQATFSVTVNSVTPSATYSIVDKNGNAITGVSPSGSYTAPAGTTSFSFANIPAGSGYKVTVTNNGCPSIEATCGTVNVANTARKMVSVKPDQSLAPTSVKAFPNPFNDKIKFSITASTSGRSSLDLYNFLGQKVKTVYQGYMEKGTMQTIEYNVPYSQRTNLMYVFLLGNQKITGKLVGMK